MTGKKGELTTQQIVLLIILIASFAIILFFILRLDFGNQSKQELCRSSVLLKGQSALPSASTPLNCHKSYECITTDGTCDNLPKPDTTLKTDNITKVYHNLAEDMATCWWMFGEGGVDYVSNDLNKNNYCSICSQVFLDNSLDSANGIKDSTISLDGLYDYMSKTKMSNSENTYLQYIFGTNDLAGLKQRISQSPDAKGATSFGDITPGKTYLIVMGITSGVSTWEWTGVGAAAGALSAGVAIAAIGSNPIGWIAGAAIFIGEVAAGNIGGPSLASEPSIVAITLNGKGISNKFMAPTIVEADSAKFASLNCKDILTYS